MLTTHSEVKAGQGSGSYLAQALGIRLARAQGKNFYTMLLYGRLANLILYLLLVALAVSLVVNFSYVLLLVVEKSDDRHPPFSRELRTDREIVRVEGDVWISLRRARLSALRFAGEAFGR